MSTTNITVTKIICGFIFLLGIYLLLNYFKKINNKCDFCDSKKEGMTTTTGGMTTTTGGMTTTTGGMLGHIKRTIHPHVRPIVRKIKASFSNPTIDYYTNKINQVFR